MQERPLRILVIDPNRIRVSIIEEGLREAGHDDVVIISDMGQLMRRVVDAEPDVIIMDLENPNRDMLEHALQVSRAARRPIAMFVDTTDAAATEAAIDAGVSAYVVDGLRKDRVKPILDMAIKRFNAIERMRAEVEAVKTELSERKMIDRAKGILMRSRGLSEEQAYQLLRKTAMNQSRKIAQVAESLILAAGLLEGDREW
ncbi:MAG: ANTAR domain-containing protein [Hyphomicrobiaceae bacterium]|nr:ANTAR domain-containing protein [Hyphomicrobiaceae bacterium]